MGARGGWRGVMGVLVNEVDNTCDGASHALGGGCTGAEPILGGSPSEKNPLGLGLPVVGGAFLRTGCDPGALEGSFCRRAS